MSWGMIMIIGNTVMAKVGTLPLSVPPKTKNKPLPSPDPTPSVRDKVGMLKTS